MKNERTSVNSLNVMKPTGLVMSSLPRELLIVKLIMAQLTRVNTVENFAVFCLDSVKRLCFRGVSGLIS